jgi:hypothetical protein
MSITNAELPSPLLYRPIGKASVFTLIEAARFIARPNEDVASIHIRLKNLAQRQLIHRRFAPDAKLTSPAYFGIDDIATAEVLLALFDVGVKSADTAQTVSRVCYAWDRTVNPRPAFIPEHISPIVAAMVGANRGESWALRLVSFHDETAGQRYLIAALFNTDVALPDVGGFLPPSFAPEADTVMNISVLMLRFGDLLREPTAH